MKHVYGGVLVLAGFVVLAVGLAAGFGVGGLSAACGPSCVPVGNAQFFGASFTWQSSGLNVTVVAHNAAPQVGSGSAGQLVGSNNSFSTTFSWGDGSSNTTYVGSSATHAYTSTSSTGGYTIVDVYRWTSSVGSRMSVMAFAIVSPAPGHSFNGSSASGLAGPASILPSYSHSSSGLNLTVTGTTTETNYTVASVYFNWGDGTPVATSPTLGAKWTHTYASAGTYHTRLTVVATQRGSSVQGTYNASQNITVSPGVTTSTSNTNPYSSGSSPFTLSGQVIFLIVAGVALLVGGFVAFGRPDLGTIIWVIGVAGGALYWLLTVLGV